MIPKKIINIMERIESSGFEAYIVGGAVRDILFKQLPNDYDIFTNANGDEILEMFPNGKVIGNEERQNKILTVIVDNVEISQYRSNGDRTETGLTLAQHLSTCDFTINSLALNKDLKIIDQNDGKRDIEYKILRFVGDPLERMKEDPLRILRGIRFWTKYHMKFENISVVLDNIDLLDTIPTERIREELLKIIKYSSGIENLWCDGIIYKIFPELKEVVAMKGGDYHNEEVDKHMNNAFKESCKITDNVILRLAVFLHDIGKGVTFTEGEDGNQTHFYEHENKGEEMMLERLKYLKFSNDEIKYITQLIRLHMYSYKDKPSKKSYIRFFNKLNDAKIPIEDYIMLIYCDHQGNLKKPRIKFGDFIKGSWLYKKYQEITYSEEPMTIKDLKIGGHDVMKYGITGKDIGNVLDRMFQLVMDGEVKNERADLLYALKVQLQ